MVDLSTGRISGYKKLWPSYAPLVHWSSRERGSHRRLTGGIRRRPCGVFGSAVGGAVEYRLVLLLTIADGRIVRDERIYDSTGVVERLEKMRLDRELRTAADLQRALMGRLRILAPFANPWVIQCLVAPSVAIFLNLSTCQVVM
jgi:hypothetical protein